MNSKWPIILASLCALLPVGAQADDVPFKARFLARFMLASQANVENAIAADAVHGDSTQARSAATWFYKAGICIGDEATAKTYRGKYKEYFDSRKQAILQTEGDERIAGFNHYMDLLNLDLDDASSLQARYADKLAALQKNQCDAQAVQTFLADAEKQEATDHSDPYMAGRLTQCAADHSQYLQLMADSKQEADPAFSQDFGIYMTAAESYTSHEQARQSYESYHQKISGDYQQILSLPDSDRATKLDQFRTDLEAALHTCVAFGLLHKEDILERTKNMPATAAPVPTPAPLATSMAPAK